jgi:hypothetical protein
MVATIHETADGHPIENEDGEPIECEDCPCGEVVTCEGTDYPLTQTLDVGSLWATSPCSDCGLANGEHVLDYDAVVSTPSAGCDCKPSYVKNVTGGSCYTLIQYFLVVCYNTSTGNYTITLDINLRTTLGGSSYRDIRYQKVVSYATYHTYAAITLNLAFNVGSGTPACYQAPPATLSFTPTPP